MQKPPRKGPYRPRPKTAPQKQETSWGHVADWYHQYVSESPDTYHEKVIKPNLLRVLGDVRGKRVLDVACGEGFFSRAIHAAGADVTGVDIAPELIAIAKKIGSSDIAYLSAPAERIPLPEESADGVGIGTCRRFDAAVCVLALQNIKNLSGALAQAAHLLKKGGEFVVVLNHPCFRILRDSTWGFDNATNIQFRRLDKYLSESSHEIQMHPGSAPGVTTMSYHRPLQLYVKELLKHGFVLAGLEEWISNRVSEKGPKAEAEDRARKEFPLFLMLKARKL